MPELISIREFARRMGVADTSVHKAIKAGVITKGLEYKNDKVKKLDYDIVLKQWQDAGRGTRKEIKKDLPETNKIKPTVPETSPAGQMSYTEATRRKQVYAQQREGLELAELQGVLVNKDKVFKELFDFAQNLRNNLLTIPDRIIDEIRAIDNRNDAHQKLYEALVTELERMSKPPTFE